MRKILMSKGARTIVEVCAGTKAGEQAVIVTEPDMLPLAEAIAAAVYAVGAEPMITLMTPRASDGQEPPPTVAAAMKASQVFFNVVRTSITHTRATRDAAAAGSRGMMMTAFTEEMLIHGGIEADFRALAPRCQAVAAAMAGATRIRLTSPHGTDLTLSIKGLQGVKCDGKLNIPDGECFTAPVIDSVNGTVRFNAGSLQDGIVYGDINLVFEKGVIVKAESGANTKKLNAVLDRDVGARRVGEFALGFNPYIEKPMLDILFDEKIAGSFHMAMGNAYKETDNGNKSSLHWDMVSIQTPKMGGGEIWFDGKLIRKDGQFVLAALQGLNPEKLR